MPRRASLIVNPSAGGGRAAELLPRAEDALRRLGVEFHVERTSGLGHARELARAAAEAGEAAVTLGGDGLISAVAGVLREADGLLGALPGGRGNDFVRVLGIPSEVEGACQVVAEGVERRIDLGEVDGHPFIGIASVGFDSVANRIANEARLVKGDLVYLYAALRALIGWKPARFYLDLDGEPRISVVGYSVGACNTRAYGGGMFVAPEAELDDGLLDVVCWAREPKARFLYHLPRVYSGTHVKLPVVHTYRAREVRMSSDRPFTIYADGDPIADLPATVRVHPRALRVIVPQ
jgi:YegS/Rv2252/BmrU family lipid kinase